MSATTTARVYLLKAKTVIFRPGIMYAPLPKSERKPIMDYQVSADICGNEVTTFDGEFNCEAAVKLCELLKIHFSPSARNADTPENSEDSQEQFKKKRNISIELQHKSTGIGRNAIYLTSIIFRGDVFRDLLLLLGTVDVSLKVMLSNTDIQPTCKRARMEVVSYNNHGVILQQTGSSFSEMWPLIQEDGSVIFRDLNVCTDDNWKNLWASTEKELNVVLTTKPHHILSPLASPRNPQDPLARLRKMTSQKFGATDVALVFADDSVQIHCHKTVLSAHSHRLKKLVETQNGRGVLKLKVQDFTEAGARALMNYLYHLDLTEARKSPQVAMELLLTGKAYSIFPLELFAKMILLNISNGDFPILMAFSLFFKVREDPNWKDLKDKCIAVCKLKHEQLKICGQYGRLFENKAEAQEFCNALLSP